MDRVLLGDAVGVQRRMPGLPRSISETSPALSKLVVLYAEPPRVRSRTGHHRRPPFGTVRPSRAERRAVLADRSQQVAHLSWCKYAL